MASSGASFLPRIQSVFYAVFDEHQGPKIVYQVPEGLIAVPPSATASNNPTNPSSPASISSQSLIDIEPSTVRPASTILTPPRPQRPESRLFSPRKRATSSSRTLFNFDDISSYVIPRSALCGRLVICATRKHRIIGFPVELRGNYERNYFRYNLCFVFERTADLSCYESVVRKVSRVLTSCEEESSFLSSPKSSPAIHAILEQLFEDLNSFSETSIPIDKFNSIELKIFPFYPNPPAVKEWQVPLALISLSKRIEPNWDLTMVKVCQYIDGTRHVARIAQLAECDLELTKLAMSHLLYYQVVMMIDIFQYSNMYTLRKSIQWLANESDVREECGPYVAKEGRVITDWPRLLHLYSRLKPGKTVRDWMIEHDVDSSGIDVRRLTSFGVIKGFLHRVHRWPILLPSSETPSPEKPSGHSSFGRRRGQTFTASTHARPSSRPEPDPMRARGRPQEPLPTMAEAGGELVAVQSSRSPISSLEQLSNRGTRRSTEQSTPSRRNSRTYGVSSSLPSAGIRVPPETLPHASSADSEPPTAAVTTTAFGRPRISRSPSAPTGSQGNAQGPASVPPEFSLLLDGEHHTDELCTRFGVGWPILKQWLSVVGGGKGEDNFGQVSIIYR